jgi:pimeloyl-ACP methyl ester carboxylesterase
MARADIDGLEIDYELFGKPGNPAVVLTLGGRFPKDDPGIPELARALAEGGKRVLIWDRPNCGASDLCFEGESESELHGRTLARLIRKLDLGPITFAGGSAGARISLVTASRNPELAASVVVWWISGGPIGCMQLAPIYCGEPAWLALEGGMEAVANGSPFKQQQERNPRNRGILLAQDPEKFVATLQRWARAYTYSDTSPVPSMSSEDWARLNGIPTLIFRSGQSDLHHTRRTSEWVHELLPSSKLIEPPWGDREWIDRVAAWRNGKGTLFQNWPKLAPTILDFTARCAAT